MRTDTRAALTWLASIDISPVRPTPGRSPTGITSRFYGEPPVTTGEIDPRPVNRIAHYPTQGSVSPSPPAAAARASRPRRFPPAASLIRSCRSTSRCDDAVARSSRSGSRGGSATATGDVSRPRCGPSRRPFHTTSNSSSSVAILEPGESCGPVEIHPGLEPGRDGQLARVDQPLIGPARHAVAPLLVADTRDARTDRQRLGAAEVSDRSSTCVTNPASSSGS